MPPERQTLGALRSPIRGPAQAGLLLMYYPSVTQALDVQRAYRLQIGWGCPQFRLLAALAPE